jgi:hypothetical protein
VEPYIVVVVSGGGAGRGVGEVESEHAAAAIRMAVIVSTLAKRVGVMRSGVEFRSRR